MTQSSRIVDFILIFFIPFFSGFALVMRLQSDVTYRVGPSDLNMSAFMPGTFTIRSSFCRLLNGSLQNGVDQCIFPLVS